MVEQTLEATEYLNVTAEKLYQYMAFVFLNGNGIFQQDNTPCHKARIVYEWFQEHKAEFQLPGNGSSEFKYHRVTISWISLTVA